MKKVIQEMNDKGYRGYHVKNVGVFRRRMEMLSVRYSLEIVLYGEYSLAFVKHDFSL